MEFQIQCKCQMYSLLWQYYCSQFLLRKILYVCGHACTPSPHMNTPLNIIGLCLLIYVHYKIGFQWHMVYSIFLANAQLAPIPNVFTCMLKHFYDDLCLRPSPLTLALAVYRFQATLGLPPGSNCILCVIGLDPPWFIIFLDEIN